MSERLVLPEVDTLMLWRSTNGYERTDTKRTITSSNRIRFRSVNPVFYEENNIVNHIADLAA